MPFCTKCGKQIGEGEQCQCSASASYAAPGAGSEFKSETGKYVKYATGEIKGSVVSSVNAWKSEIKSTDAYERNIPIVPNTLKANEGEVPIKQYNHIARLRSRKLLTWAEGKMQVTSKRLIFRAPGRNILAGRQALQHEFDINDVAGVEFKKNYRFVPLDVLFGTLIFYVGFMIMAMIFGTLYEDIPAISIILGLVAGAALTLPLFMLKGFHPYVKLLCYSGAMGSFLPLILWLVTEGEELGALLSAIIGIALLIVLIIRMFKVILQPNLQIVIKTKSGLGAVTIRHTPVVTGLGALFGGNNNIINFSGFDEVLPDVDTEAAIRELGAVIADVQSMGDKALEKWR